MTQHAGDIDAVPDGEAMRALTLDVGGEVFAIEATSVREILDMVPVTEVPNAPAFVGGLINVRGRVVPLADLRVKFGMEHRPPDTDTRIVVFEITLEEEPTVVGMLADRVHTVADIALSAMEAAPKVGMRWRPEFVRGIAKHDGNFIVVPEMNQVFSNGASAAAMSENESRAG